MVKYNNKDLTNEIISGNRRSLSKAITLIESSLSSHRNQANDLLKQIIPYAGKSIRIGISGPPGVGKSTLIESLGLNLLEKNRSVAVLAIDPSSNISGGSILGDKTRMERLSSKDNVYIRPTPAGELLGGVARHTRETIMLCESAGFDTILVETVGVGQSEATVASMVDIFILVIAPGGGDELQGIKRGIVELSDLIVVNKADGDLLSGANQIASEYSSALSLIRAKSSNWKTKVITCSAITNHGIDKIWEIILKFIENLEKNVTLSKYRGNQYKQWLWQEIQEGFLSEIKRDNKIGKMVTDIEEEIADQNELPSVAAEQILNKFFNKNR
ncbi:methylmalonyl Co-A mutase-associated GTPase MeaB [Alphaproteobacteria bacterium]|nr:methylmalonyl Co-A mutase-associated GTPase MeaB [Alphaproteobacteria bacterium]